ncbi:MAG: hypothetical protein U9N35_00115 [Euryarchaeota archaeon]|nr:hypothetical protein [Euryarchaeota archaeon]
MDKKGKILGMMAAVAIIISVVMVSVPAEKEESTEKYSPKIPKEKREWMAREEKKIQEELKDPEFVKKLERSKNRKWYSYEELYREELDEEDKEYMRILKRMEREGIDTTELFDEIEEYLESQYQDYLESQSTGSNYNYEKLDIVQFAKDFEKREFGKKGAKNDQERPVVYNNSEYVHANGKRCYGTDRIYYTPFNQEVYVRCLSGINDNLMLYLRDTSYVGLGIWVHLYNGTVYDFTWKSYYTAQNRVNYVLWYLNANYGIASDDIRLIHMKYFIQGSYVEDLYHYSEQEWVYLVNKEIELWSEANYYPNSGTWNNYGYPDVYQGGARIIEDNGHVYTSTGCAYHTPYPYSAWRTFGGGSETHVVLRLFSHPLHQQAVLS